MNIYAIKDEDGKTLTYHCAERIKEVIIDFESAGLPWIGLEAVLVSEDDAKSIIDEEAGESLLLLAKAGGMKRGRICFEV